MKLFNWLFHRKNTKNNAQVAASLGQDIEGFMVYPEAREEAGQYRIAGRICKVVDGELKTHIFIRSDLLATRELADELMLSKAALMINQAGDSIFS